jgi:4'-phosphopantetheinyl transferase
VDLPGRDSSGESASTDPIVSPFTGTHFARLMLQRHDGWTGFAYLCWSSASLELLDRCKDRFLSPAELRLAQQFHFDRRRRAFLLGRYCAKEALAALLRKREFAAIDIIPGVFNQPVIVNPGARASVSISHTDHIAAALAFDSTHPMGLDIERLNEGHIGAIDAQLTSNEKLMTATSSSDGPKTQFVLWTMKEALAKVLLTGLMTPLSIYELAEIVRDRKSWRATFKNFGQYQAAALSVHGHIIAVALPRKTDLTVDIFRNGTWI